MSISRSWDVSATATMAVSEAVGETFRNEIKSL